VLGRLAVDLAHALEEAPGYSKARLARELRETIAGLERRADELEDLRARRGAAAAAACPQLTMDPLASVVPAAGSWATTVPLGAEPGTVFCVLVRPSCVSCAWATSARVSTASLDGRERA
jgi:hypothetical protein